MEGTAFSVRSTDPGLLEVLRRYLGVHLIDRPEIGERHYRFSADCGEELKGAGGLRARRVGSLYLNTLRLFRARGFDEMAGRFISSLRDIATFGQDQFVRIRAGAVVAGGSVLVLPAEPEPHLPGLVAHLVRRGAEYLADEVVRIEPVLREVHPLPLPLLLAIEDMPDFPEIRREPATSRRTEDREGLRQIRYAVLPEEVAGSTAGPGVPGRVVFPRFEPGETALETIGSADALFAFARAGLNFHVWGERALILGREMLSSVPTATLRVGSMARAADILLEESSAPGAMYG